MKTTLRVAYSPLLGLALMGFTQRDTAALTQTTPSPKNTIKLLTLNQPPCSMPSSESTITAKLAYLIAEQEQSEQGFSVSIKFQGVDPRMTFSVGTQGNLTVKSKQDTLTLTYPMAAIWSNPRLKRPLTCYFYLHRYTTPNRSVVIAKTPPIVFQECQ